MSKIENAIRNLTPEQRALLELRLKKKRQQSTDVPTEIVQRSDTSVYPISAGQRRLLTLEQLTPGTSRYNITEAYRLMGPLDITALESSIRATIDRHAVLRARFILENGTWRQEVVPTPEEPLYLKNLSHMAATQRLGSAISLVRKDLVTPFDLSEGRLIRPRLVRLAANDHIFFVTMHHVVCDAWSFDLLLKEIALQYQATINQERPDLPDLPIQYADFAAWQSEWLASAEAEKQHTFWQNEFEYEVKPIILPSNQDQAASRSTDGAQKRIILAEELVSMLMEVSIEQKLTPFSLFLSAFKSTLYRYSGQSELIACVPVAGRNRVEIESLVGYFNNLLPLRTSFNDDLAYTEVAEQITKKAAEASDHQEIPFETIATLPSLRRVPLTRLFFTFQTSLSESFQLPGIEIDAIELENTSADFDLALYVEQKGEDIVVAAEYKSQVFEEETISELLSHYVHTLKSIADDPTTRLGDLPSYELPYQPEEEEELEVELEEEAEQPAPRSITLTVNGTEPGGDMLPPSADPKLPEPPAQKLVKAESLPMAAPEDDIEQILTRIWERALGISNIGIHDNFFDLGGHSLMAVDIFNEIQKYIADTDLPLVALLEAPTIYALAERIRNGEEEEWSPLAVIQAGRGSIPLFCVHGAGGNVLLYRDLAIQLGPNQTVYGLQSQGMDGSRPILGRIEDMAALYIRAIRKVQPEGPYLLLGYCMGGTVALEMAQQLKAKGHKVALLAMLETYNWSNAPKETFFSKIRYYFEKLEFHIRNYFLLSNTERKIFRSEKAAELQRRKKVWRGKLSVAMKPDQLIPSDGMSINPRALAEVWRTNDEASMVYEPEEYAGRIMHFIPMKEYSFHRNDGLGWENIAHELETHVLSVFPAGMLVQPFVKELAQALRAEIYAITSQVYEENTPESEPSL